MRTKKITMFRTNERANDVISQQISNFTLLFFHEELGRMEWGVLDSIR
jgi:hypothetical protein